MWGARDQANLLCCLLLAACNSGAAPGLGGAGQGPLGDGSAAGKAAHAGGGGQASQDPAAVGVKLTALQDPAAAALQAPLSAAAQLTTDTLLSKHALSHVKDLGYDPSTALGLDTIQASKLALDDEEQQLLRQNGFVVSGRRSFPSMLTVYAELYAADLPLYVSADSVLNAVHLSYDSILADIETAHLIGSLERLVDGMRQKLPQHASSPASADADLFLTITKSLLSEKPVAPVAGAKQSEIDDFVSRAQSAVGTGKLMLFGTPRDIDFSQFKPRGHYTDSPALSRYFRAMMWLGRIDLRLIETLPDGSQVFRRRQFDAMLLLRSLLSDAQLALWTQVDSTLQTFVGKSDYMRFPEVDALLKDLGVDASGAAALSDQTVAQTIIDKGYGTQQIASQLIVNDTRDGRTLPLDRSFALFGQRYVIDSHVFSNVVYDRVKQRLMPDPLDVAFAAFGNDAALPLLKSELDKYSYAAALEQTRVLADAHGADYWNSNLYTSWLGALRALSPSAKDVLDPGAAGLPKLTSTEAWSRRVLSTQLASWAELRHDTILYAKQSYTSAPACEYPDAYVEPYPAVFAALGQLADNGLRLSDSLNVDGPTGAGLRERIRSYFTQLRATVGKLEQMAQAQRSGTPFSGEQLAFINEAVHSYSPGGCAPGPKMFDGWFAKLHYGVGADGRVVSEFKATIADVHTQPADEGGNPVGRILHVGTGKARLMVVTLDTCRGARAYAGAASSYHELITTGFNRVNDLEWRQRFQTENPPEPLWTGSFISKPL